jgi:signal transduction histidine kinase
MTAFRGSVHVAAIWSRLFSLLRPALGTARARLASPRDAPQLAEMLADCAQRFSRRSGVSLALSVAPGWTAFRLEPGAGRQLVQVVQEALSNIRRHAAARHVVVALELQAGAAQIRVEDDGCGFYVSRLLDPYHPHAGLDRLRDRVRAIGGTCRIAARPGQGTGITVRLPSPAPELGRQASPTHPPSGACSARYPYA